MHQALLGRSGSLSLMRMVAAAGDWMYTPGDADRNTSNDSGSSGKTSSISGMDTVTSVSPDPISTIVFTCLKSSPAVESREFYLPAMTCIKAL